MITKQELDFIASIAAAAQCGQQEWGVPASITIAQGILESGWGKSQLAIRGNNYFGIKALNNQDYCHFDTTEYIDKVPEKVHASFAKYVSARECFEAHARLLATLPLYAPCMAVANDPKKFATQLRACKYCTLLPMEAYPDRLMELINQFDLTQYDHCMEPSRSAQNQNQGAK